MKALIFLAGLCLSFTVVAETADVLKVTKRQAADKSWSFSVTIAHADTGWDDYANGWDVVLPDGTVLKKSKADKFTRTLWHPHVEEQPFTRSQGGLIIPEGVNEVTIRAHASVDGWGGMEIVVNLTE